MIVLSIVGVALAVHVTIRHPKPAVAIPLYLLAIVLCIPAVAEGRPADWGASTTAYCLQGRMADGTFVRSRSAASNRHPLGTRIRLTGRQAGPGGYRKYVVRDRIGHGTELDLWTGSCGEAIRFGRRRTSYRIGWGR